MGVQLTESDLRAAVAQQSDSVDTQCCGDTSSTHRYWTATIGVETAACRCTCSRAARGGGIPASAGATQWGSNRGAGDVTWERKEGKQLSGKSGLARFARASRNLRTNTHCEERMRARMHTYAHAQDGTVQRSTGVSTAQQRARKGIAGEGGSLVHTLTLASLRMIETHPGLSPEAGGTGQAHCLSPGSACTAHTPCTALAQRGQRGWAPLTAGPRCTCCPTPRRGAAQKPPARRSGPPLPAPPRSLPVPQP